MPTLRVHFVDGTADVALLDIPEELLTYLDEAFTLSETWLVGERPNGVVVCVNLEKVTYIEELPEEEHANDYPDGS